MLGRKGKTDARDILSHSDVSLFLYPISICGGRTRDISFNGSDRIKKGYIKVSKVGSKNKIHYSTEGKDEINNNHISARIT